FIANEFTVQYSNALAYNANAAMMKAAVEELLNFDSTITFSGPISGGAVTATYGSTYANMPLDSRGWQLLVENISMVTAGGAPVGVATTVATPSIHRL